MYAFIKYNASCTPAADKDKYKAYSDFATSKYNIKTATYIDYINLVNQSYNQTGIDCSNYFKTAFSLPGIPGDIDDVGCIKLDPTISLKINKSFVKTINIPVVMGDINFDCKTNSTDALLVSKMYIKEVNVTTCNK